MPKKLLRSEFVPTLIQERLTVWGRCIHAQRLHQRITAADLCQRMGVSDNTLRRLERGDPGAGAGNYLSALMILGLLDELAPAAASTLMSAEGQRVKKTQEERAVHDIGYF